MKTFTHRGWSEGEGENTLSAFKKSVEAGMDGAEFDVRLDSLGRTVVLSHDPAPAGTVLPLYEALAYLASTNMELLIEFKEYSDKLFELVIEHLRYYNLSDRSTIFAFPEVATQFPWGARQGAKLGIIAPYPQDISKYIKAYNPDMVLMGWGDIKERRKFKIAWTFLSLKKVFVKYSNVKFVIGVAYTETDKSWLSKQNGLYGFTVNMPLE